MTTTVLRRMRKAITICASLWLAAFLPLQAATVKRKEGTIVQGQIQGYVVQQCNITGDGSKARKGGPSSLGSFGEMALRLKPGGSDAFLAGLRDVYRITRGEHIQSIEEDGLLAPSDKSIYIKVLEDKPIRPELVFAPLGKWLEEEIAIDQARTAAFLKDGYSVMAFSADSSKLDQKHCRLLGEFQQVEGSGEILPGIRLETDSGMISIPVGEIVATSKKQK